MAPHVESDVSPATGRTRRDVIKKVAVGTAIAWTAPLVLDSFVSTAMAFTCTGACFKFEVSSEDCGETTGNANNSKAPCQPAYPPDRSGACTIPSTKASDSTANLGLTFNSGLSYDLNRDTGVRTQPPAFQGSTNCHVPNLVDGIGHKGIDRFRVFDFDPAVFASMSGLSCLNPRIHSIALALPVASGKGRWYDGSAWVTATTGGTACCATPGVAPGEGTNSCNSITIDGGARSADYSVSLQSDFPSGDLQRSNFYFDGRYQAMAAMSGWYRFVVGCGCDQP